MLVVASLVSMAMVFIAGLDKPSWWPVVFLAELALSWVMLAHRMKQLEKKAKIYEYEHP